MNNILGKIFFSVLYFSHNHSNTIAIIIGKIFKLARFCRKDIIISENLVKNLVLNLATISVKSIAIISAVLLAKILSGFLPLFIAVILVIN